MLFLEANGARFNLGWTTGDGGSKVGRVTGINHKRLAWYIVSAFLIYLLSPLVVFLVKPLLPPSTQEVHMKQVKAHIEKITPAWNNFKSTNAGFELVEFRVYTAGNGQLLVGGFVTSEIQRQKVIQFVLETHPPRSLYTNTLQVVEPDVFQSLLGDKPSSKP